MEKKKRSYKWMIWSMVATSLVAIGLIIFILIYEAGYQDNLKAYEHSIENLSEVSRVLEFSEYSGTESYFVAIVERVDEEEYVYFVKDGIVEHQVPVGDLITADEARQIAVEVADSQQIMDTKLGLHEEAPIYEVRLRTAQGVQYVIIDGLTMEIVLNFTLD